MSCSVCLRDLKIVGRGYCKSCYQRWQKRGTTDYAPKRVRNLCQIDDCQGAVVSNGLCDMHRNRLRRHGHTEVTRPDSWGAKSKHPMYHSWSWLMRYRAQHPIAPEWEDFLQFISDVGKRPSPKHKLYAANDSAPIGPGNFVWKEAITQKVDGEEHQTYMNRARRVYNSVRKEAFQGYELKKSYGISKADYVRMSEDQGHACAICGEPEKMTIRGNLMALAVDHCHNSGAVRGLLCVSCNRALGLLKDDPTRLRAAITYLEKHILPDAA